MKQSWVVLCMAWAALLTSLHNDDPSTRAAAFIIFALYPVCRAIEQLKEP